MCRNIKTLFNFDPPATHAEIHASALQFVRKLSGSTKPSARCRSRTSGLPARSGSSVGSAGRTGTR